MFNFFIHAPNNIFTISFSFHLLVSTFNIILNLAMKKNLEIQYFDRISCSKFAAVLNFDFGKNMLISTLSTF